MSTLEEIFEADIVLLVVDGSEDLEMIFRKLSDSLGILRRGGTEGRIVLAVNKMDLLDVPLMEDEIFDYLKERLSGSELGMIEKTVFISAHDRSGIETLVRSVQDILPPLIEVRMRIPSGPGTEILITSVRRHSAIREERYESEGLILVADMEERWAGHFLKRIHEAGGIAIIRDE